TQVVINDGQPRTINYVNNQSGQVIKRDVTYSSGSTSGVHEEHYYLANRSIGDVTNNGTSNTDYVTSVQNHVAVPGYGPFQNGAEGGTQYADFDQSYDPINGMDSGSVANTYTAQAGDTLQSVAQALWGDARLWYLIASANGYTSNMPLAAG